LHLFEASAAVIADLNDVIPDITGAETHAALAGYPCVWTSNLLEHFNEFNQAHPFRPFAVALAHRARDIAGVNVASVVFVFTDRQVGLAVAVLAGGKDMDFEHMYLLSGVKQKSPP
jgi:hypothetical protein